MDNTLMLQAASKTSNKPEFLERAGNSFHSLKERTKPKDIKTKISLNIFVKK